MNIIEKIKPAIKFVVPVAFAGVIAVVQAIGEQKEAARIDNMEHRIEELESKAN